MDTTIVIQGPADFYREVLASRSPKFKYIWSTWSYTPPEVLKAIEDSGVELVVSDPPSYNGLYNVNYQCKSATAGLKLVKTPYAVKIRSDITLRDTDGFVQMWKEKTKTLAFLAYHNWQGGYTVDYMSFGLTVNSQEYWDYYQDHHTHIPPERQILNKYIKAHPEIQPTFESTKENFYLFLGDMVARGLDAYWHKAAHNFWLSTYIPDPLYMH